MIHMLVRLVRLIQPIGEAKMNDDQLIALHSIVNFKLCICYLQQWTATATSATIQQINEFSKQMACLLIHNRISSFEWLCCVYKSGSIYQLPSIMIIRRKKNDPRQRSQQETGFHNARKKNAFASLISAQIMLHFLSFMSLYNIFIIILAQIYSTFLPS